MNCDLHIQRNNRKKETNRVALLSVALVLGVLSIVVFETGTSFGYGRLGLLGQFPIIWLGGFTVYPGYIFELWRCNGSDQLLCILISIIVMSYLVATLLIVWKSENPIRRFAIFYLISLPMNVLNFFFVALLHV